jgi:long-chain acyl-CoA synthetase
MVHGDGRKYLTALIALDKTQLRAWAAREKLPAAASDPRVRTLVEAHVAAVNAQLAPHEAIRQFAILPRDFTEADGELTPTLKIRRREITRKYQDLLDSLY